MNFNPMNFITNSPYILKGMLGTFFALGIIAISMILLNKLIEDSKKSSRK